MPHFSHCFFFHYSSDKWFFRVKSINNGSENFIWGVLPNFKLFFATDPELAHFLLNLQPNIIRKAGFSRELFGGDKNGFLYGLLYDEGESWQRNRKLIGKQLHLSVLESYIEVSFFLHTIAGCHVKVEFRVFFEAWIWIAQIEKH